ncbi:hypothetical protein J7L65_06740 [Candidatus Bathyarchaeota archaeon]|nr:hypothetical protein [Candidatus Bathyarchaeota archaeon]
MELGRAALILAVLTLLIAGLEATPFASAYQERAMELLDRFNSIMDETLSFLDHAWEIAEEFKNPDFDYDPSLLLNHTALNGTG